MRNGYLTFEKCIQRLEHSFLRVKHAYFEKKVDFQHPSLRDMLLNILQNEPQVKRQYILNASPSALSSIIRGVSLYNQTSGKESHVLILNNKNELSLLLGRINAVINDTIRHLGLQEILSSAEALIPQKNEKNIAPADFDLVKFSRTAQGKVVKTVLTSFGKQDTCNNNTQYPFSVWTNLLHKFYQLTPYIVPIPRVEYIDILMGRFKKANISEKIKFVSLLSLHEPLKFKQIFSSKLEKLCNKYIREELQECIKECELESWDVYTENDQIISEYDAWLYLSEQMLIFADEFYSSTHLEPQKEISELRSLIELTPSPFMPDEEDIQSLDYDYYKGHEYWTIERVFEDL